MQCADLSNPWWQQREGCEMVERCRTNFMLKGAGKKHSSRYLNGQDAAITATPCNTGHGGGRRGGGRRRRRRRRRKRKEMHQVWVIARR